MSRDSFELEASDDADTAEYSSVDAEAATFFEAEPRTRVRVDVAGKTHPGLVRPNNEDQYLAVRRYRGREILATSVPEEFLDPIDDHAYVLAVADGLGGQKFGEIASLLALRTGWELGGDEIKWIVRLNEHEIEEIRQKAEVFCRLLDESLQAEIRENPRLAGMGTTLTLCYSTGPNLFTIQVGDSRAYLHREGSVRQLTRDHTLGQQLVDSGTLDPSSRIVQRFRHVLTNCIGRGAGEVSPDVEHHALLDGDRVLLCTDGLSNMVSDDEIAKVLDQNPSSADACDTLIELALKHGGTDNVTVVVAHYRFDGRR